MLTCSPRPGNKGLEASLTLGWLGGEELVVLVGQDRSGVQNLLDQVGNRFIEDMRLQTGVPASTQ